MKTYKAKSGVFSERVYYERGEMENICLNALESVELLPAYPSPIRIERFLERYFYVSPKYQNLPDGVLGYTEFGANGVENIVIAESLDSDGTVSAERRIRSTMAHEGGHGLFHMHLFVFGTKSLFGETDERQKVMCRDDLKNAIVNGSNRYYDGNWAEFQANVAIGALLMPRPLVLQAVAPFLSNKGEFIQTINEDVRSEAGLVLAETFDVNPAVAKIRINEIFERQKSEQLAL